MRMPVGGTPIASDCLLFAWKKVRHHPRLNIRGSRGGIYNSTRSRAAVYSSPLLDDADWSRVEPNSMPTHTELSSDIIKSGEPATYGYMVDTRALLESLADAKRPGFTLRLCGFRTAGPQTLNQ